MNGINSIVLTCDRYIRAIPAFLYFYEKYWPERPHVTVVGYEIPKFIDKFPHWASFQSLGEDRGVELWSNGLIQYLHGSRQDHFILFLEDYWMTAPVKHDIVSKLWSWTVANQRVLKMDLRTDRRFSGMREGGGSVDHIPLVKSLPNSPYHMSLMTGIFSKVNLLKILRPGMSPWDVEIAGTRILSEYGDAMQVFGTDPWTDDPRIEPMSHTISLRGGNNTDLQLDGMNEEDRKKAIELWNKYG